MAKFSAWIVFALCLLKVFGLIPLPWSIILAPLWIPLALMVFAAVLVYLARGMAWLALHLLVLLAILCKTMDAVGVELYRDMHDAFQTKREIKHEPKT